MNTALVDYGIFQERSDFRAHVAVIERAVYIYETPRMVALLREREYKKRSAYTGDIKTAEGFLVPPAQVPGIQRLLWPVAWAGRITIDEDESTSQKGVKAAKIVAWFLRHNRVMLPLIISDISQRDLQVEGVDILVKLSTRIQVKCDYRASWDRGVPMGSTGNMFVQVTECNPYRQT